MMCQFNADNLRCNRCGFKAKRLPTYRVCRTIPEMAEYMVAQKAANRIRVPPVPIGTAVKKTLTAVGVTEDRFKKLLGGRPCGCGERANALDRLGGKMSLVVERAANAVLNAVLPASPAPDDVAKVSQYLHEHAGLNEGLKTALPR